MARKQCHVVLACRSKEKTEKVVEDIKRETGNEKVEFMELNLLSLNSVKNFAQEFIARYDKLHILLNNAGVMNAPFALSEDGKQFATNHVGHYYLTILLLPVLEKTKPSRIINVSSMGHQLARSLNLETINDLSAYHSGWQYCKTKACNILFTRELVKRLKQKGIEHIYVNSNHPGVVRSELTRHMFSVGGVMNWLYDHLLTITTEDGALAQLYLATSPEVEEKNIRGQYYVSVQAAQSMRSS
ncbi:hypothetical protein EC973_008099 [Apophysomyces ossiformis]|uniref:Uncharacterized protein n=1 Tax=Apophysomyces ossiformis TaxID=679940 RepID=A0A8H7BNU8_9FUNG|nr:hypothetical protein EC973_008099 [Apophysomyces ossiformis]